ncbi:MAG: T9SS type A sorting domain-containing protein [Bacteroidota bacterium]
MPTGKHRFRLKQVDHDGAFTYSHEVEVQLQVQEGTFYLTSPFPNPFSTQTVIRLEAAQTQPIEVTVLDVLGREVRQLLKQVVSDERAYEVILDAQDLPSGLYLIRVRGDGFVMTQSVLLQR